MGWNRATGRPVTLGWDQLFEDHVLLLGKTRMGKTTLLEYWIRQMVKARHGVALFDPEGTIYKRVQAFLYRIDFPPEKVHIIDLEEGTYCAGLNYFDLVDTPADAIADLVLEAFAKIAHQGDEYRPLIERYGRSSLIPLCKAGVPFGFLYDFLTDQALRASVLTRANDDYANKNWHALAKRSSRDQEADLLGILNRADLMARSPEKEAFFSQERSAVDWGAAMDAGDVVLVNLHNTSQKFAQMVGIMLIHQLSKAAIRRREGATPHFFTIVDEFSRFLTDDFREAVKMFGKRNVHFIFSTQDLDDLMGSDGRDRRFYNSVMSNTATKIVFAMRSADYCAEMARNLFAGVLSGEQIKYWGEHPVWKPIPKKEEVEVYSESSSTSQPGATHSQSESSPGSDPDEEEIITVNGLVEHDAGYTTSESVTRSTQRYTDYEEIILKQTPVFRSLDEELHLYTKWIFAQGKGECQVLYDPKKPPLAIRTPVPGSPHFKEAFAKPERMQAYLESVYRAMSVPTYTQAIAERERKDALLRAPADPSDDDETYDQPQANPLPDDEP